MTVGLEVSFANQILTATLGGGGTPSWPTAVWVKMHIGDPGAAGTANPAANATQKQVTWGAPAAGQATNSAVVEWTDAEVTTTETYTHFSARGASGGTFKFSGVITNASVAASNQAFRLNIGQLVARYNVAA